MLLYLVLINDFSKVPVDIKKGLRLDQAEDLAVKLGFDKNVAEVEFIKYCIS